MFCVKKHYSSFLFQVIIPGCWIFALISNIPIFLSVNYKNTIGDCEEDWPKKWMGIANSMGWFVIMAFLPMLVMSGSYSRVVYTLWFKQTDKNKLSPRQKVRNDMKHSVKIQQTNK